MRFRLIALLTTALVQRDSSQSRRRLARQAAVAASAAVVAFTGCGGGSTDNGSEPALSERDPAGDVHDARRRGITSTRPELDLRAAGITVDAGVLRLALRTEAPLRRGIFTFAAQGCDAGGLLVAIRIVADEATVVRTVDPARPHLRAVEGARASVDGTRMTATVPLRDDTDLDRSWIVWSADADDELADSIPDWNGIDGADISPTTPDYGNGNCHPEIRLIR